MFDVINLCGLAEKGFLPSSGSVLDQSAWFLDAWMMTLDEQNTIDAERMRRLSGK